MHLGYHPVRRTWADARGNTAFHKKKLSRPLGSCSSYASVSRLRVLNMAFLRLIQLATGISPDRL